MKTAAYAKTNFMSRPVIPLPNVVTRRQFLRKALDVALIVACGVGISVMILFLLALA